MSVLRQCYLRGHGKKTIYYTLLQMAFSSGYNPCRTNLFCLGV